MDLYEIRELANDIQSRIKHMLQAFEDETGAVIKEVAIARDRDGLKQVLLDVSLT